MSGKIYGYIRVSSRDQNEDRQRIAMREYGVSDNPIRKSVGDKGILDSCRVKFIMQMEEQEARLVQEKLALTEEETRMITRFRRGEGLLCIGHNHVPIAIHVSPKEYEAITTSPTDLRARLRQEG